MRLEKQYSKRVRVQIMEQQYVPKHRLTRCGNSRQLIVYESTSQEVYELIKTALKARIVEGDKE